MKRKTIPFGLVLFLLSSLCWMACKKESNKVTALSYSGQAQASYEFHSLNFMTGEFKEEVWDSIYDDRVEVVIDRQINTITFSFHPNSYKVQPSATTYSYPLDQTSQTYTTSHASHVTQSFSMWGDSLQTRYDYYIGYAPNYTRQEINFSGKTLP